MYRLPPLPPALQALAPLRVGAAARLTHGGAGLHQPPELWVQATREEVEVRCAGQAAPGWPDHLAVGPFLVRPLAGVAPAQALAERAVPLDAFALAADDAPLDPLGGLADLAAGRLRLPEPAALEADPSLLVHLPALASELGLTLPEELAALLAEQAGLVLRADRHRLREAMTRLLVSRRPQAGLELLHRLGVLTLVLPEVVALIDFHRSSRHHHKDVWQHTLQVVGQAVPRPSVRWAALLHDIGKTYTRSYTPDRKVHFLLHDELGAVMCEGITARLRFPPVLAARVERLVRFHLRANVYDPNWSDAAVRRFALELGEDPRRAAPAVAGGCDEQAPGAAAPGDVPAARAAGAGGFAGGGRGGTAPGGAQGAGAGHHHRLEGGGRAGDRAAAAAVRRRGAGGAPAGRPLGRGLPRILAGHP
jgi:putative nucleotidyltransferase with HDIG domain